MDAQEIDGFVRTMKEYATDIQTDVALMAEALIMPRLACVSIVRDTWTESQSTMSDHTTFRTYYSTALKDTKGNRTVFGSMGEDAYNAPDTFVKDKGRYLEHLRWDHTNVTYSAVDAVARLTGLPEAVGAACRRLNSEVLACSQFRYAALREGVMS